MAAPPRTLFFGSGPLALPALGRLRTSPLVVLDSVVTAPPRPAGRNGRLTPTPVAEAAGAAGIAIRTPSTLRSEAVQEGLRASGVELIVLADYGRLIPAAVLALPRLGALNIHPSLLPRHRGAAPVQGAILAGDARTGVTLMRMDEGLDTGPIVAQAAVDLAGDETAPELEARLARLGADLLMEYLPGWIKGSVQARPQPAEGATLTRPLRREDGRLDPTRPARELERQVRALQPWPGTFLEIDGERLKVWRAGVDSTVIADHADALIAGSPAGSPAGSLVPLRDGVALATAEGLLRLDEVQPAGRRRMSGADYRRGRLR